MGNIPPSALRPPPPPRRRAMEGSLMSGVEDSNSKEEDNRSRVVRTRPYYFRRCKTKKLNPTNIESLPVELLLEILVRLTADDIYDKARLVCRRWRNLIHTDAFVHAHLRCTRSGLLLGLFRSTSIFMAAATDGGVEISKLSYKVRFPTMASCNGLVMGMDFTENYAPYIVNPSTKCPFNLPRYFDRTRPGHFGIAYAAASMEYKVVGTYLPDSEKPVLVQCYISTAGVDSTWRHVAIQHLSPRANELLLHTPEITRGFMHWASTKGPDVLTLNVETEIMTETPVPLFPPDYPEKGHNYYYLSTERYLTVLLSRGEFSWEVWEMKPESGEWRRVLPNIDLEAAHKCRIQQFSSKNEIYIKPVGWVRYPELLAFFFQGTGYSKCSRVIFDLKEAQTLT